MGRCKHLAIWIFKCIKHIALHNMLLGLSQFVILPFSYSAASGHSDGGRLEATSLLGVCY